MTDKLKRPTKAIINLEPFLRALHDKNPNLVIEGVEAQGVINAEPLTDYVDEKVESVVRPEPSLQSKRLTPKEIGEMPEGDERKMAVRHLISGDEFTTMRISREMQQKLTKIGGKGDTFDDIIRKLVNKVQKNAGGES